MKHKLSSLNLLALAFLLSVSIAQAQWLQHTNVIPGTSTTAIFPGAVGPYTGVVSTTASNFVGGQAGPGVGLLPTAFTNVTPTFTANFPLNPGNTFNYVNISYDNLGESYDVTMNFAGLALGYLPQGSLIAMLDVDITENIHNLTAVGPGGGISTAWLTQLGIGPFDYDNTSGDGINPFDVATITFAGGVYNFLGHNSQQISAFQGFTTTQDLTSMTWHFDRGGGGAGTGGYGVAIGQAIPEPASTTLAFLGGIGSVFAWLRKRKLEA